MKQELPALYDKQLVQINRYGYLLYLVFAVYLIIHGSTEMAMINFGVAMVFDPFDIRVKWENRAAWQRAWFLIHFILALSGIFYFSFVL